MQDMSPDMEDLLRKASENYPMRQTEDRWNEIASKISPGPATQPIAKKTGRYKKYVATFLLLLMFLFLDLFILKPVESDKLSQKDQLKTKGSSQEVDINSKKGLPANTKEKTVKAHQVSGDNENDYLKSVKSNLTTKSSQNNSLNDVNTVSLKSINKQKNINAENDPVNYTELYMRPNKNNEAISKIITEPYENKISLRPKIFSLDTVSHFPSSTLNSKEKKSKNLFFRKGLYYGLIAGPGFNTIKNQGLTKAGLNIGILGGYRFTKAFSFETGLMLSQKFYTTSGEHFSMKVIGPAMPSAMKVMEVDGNTRLLEIPIHLRYEIFQNNKRSFFSLAGFSSYIVDKESNQYHTSMNGTEEMVYGTYKSNRSYFASSINFGIGCQQNLGKKNAIRFQPYIQLPLKGIGVGDLQVMSTGLFIGITRTAH